jgi:cyclophilin family peptidyl-prolyl cis-trans isomerase
MTSRQFLPLLPLLGSVLLLCGGCPVSDPFVAGGPRARVSTTLGDIVVELDPNDAPLTVANFYSYVDEGFYSNTLFDRAVPNFVIQGGAFTSGLQAKPAHAAIITETNGLRNLRGTLAMAHGDAAVSTTAQFFINLHDNPSLDPTLTSVGYTVFGQVVEGQEVADQIGLVATQAVGDLTNVPVTDVVIQSVTREAPALSVNPAWTTYAQSVQYNTLSGLRSIAVNVLSGLLTNTGH